jgi:exonuclease VII small subunit
MSPHVSRGQRRPRFGVLIGAVTAALALAVATGCGEDDASVAVVDQAVAAEHSHATASTVIHTEAGHAFQDEMRKLWEDHVTWTRLAIVSFVDDLSDLEPTVARLLQNQTDIGDAIKPYYGDEAGEQLTRLLEGHINGAVELLSAAKAGDQKQVKKARAAWYRNGNQIADFLSEANPDNWPRAEMRSMMRTHLDQTLAEATQRLEGDHEAEIRTYDEIHDHILEMADVLSDGIFAQFPGKFE